MISTIVFNCFGMFFFLIKVGLNNLCSVAKHNESKLIGNYTQSFSLAGTYMQIDADRFCISNDNEVINKKQKIK